MDRTEKRLRMLFDFQRFSQNRSLDRVIRAVETGGALELEDSDLELYAAGEADAWRTREGEEKRS